MALPVCFFKNREAHAEHDKGSVCSLVKHAEHMNESASGFNGSK